MFEVSKEETFLLKKFREFYSTHKVKFPSNVEQREFGIGAFGKKIANRHLSFSSADHFNKFLIEQTPLYVSYSNAYYEFPSRTPMSAKHFLKADLVYEFDADDFFTDCKEEHDSWKCTRCGKEGKGAITNCTACGASVSLEQWFCEKCLDKTKKETLRLLEILRNDFNFSEDISVNFSGNAGYHIHLESEQVKTLTQVARIELLNYLTLHELDLELCGFNITEKSLSCPRIADAKGISKRLLVNLINFIENESVDKIASIGGIRKSDAQKFLENKSFLLEKMKQGVLLPLPFTRPKTSKRFWFSLIDYIIKESGIALNVDRQTSIDLHKIVRVPDTLHGGTGLLAKNILLDKLDSFNPLDDAIVFSDSPVKVFINNSPRFYLKGESFGPFNNAEEELPEFAAIYLIAKKKAFLR